MCQKPQPSVLRRRSSRRSRRLTSTIFRKPRSKRALTSPSEPSSRSVTRDKRAATHGSKMAAGASSAVAEAGDEVDEAAGSVAGAKSIAAGAALLGVRRLQLSSPCTTSGRPRRRLRATMLR